MRTILAILLTTLLGACDPATSGTDESFEADDKGYVDATLSSDLSEEEAEDTAVTDGICCRCTVTSYTCNNPPLNTCYRSSCSGRCCPNLNPNAYQQ